MFHQYQSRDGNADVVVVVVVVVVVFLVVVIVLLVVVVNDHSLFVVLEYGIRMDGRTNGRTRSLIEMCGRISIFFYIYKFFA